MRSALAATSSVAPLPAEATTSLLPIAFSATFQAILFAFGTFPDEEH